MLTIREPHADEAEAMTALCLRSKASWGYDDAFMAASTPSLTVTQERLAGEPFWVAEEGGHLLGVAAIVETDLGWELDLLFVDGHLKRSGVGRALLDHVVAALRAMGVGALMIQSDPYAEGFYLRYGAKRVGELESEALPGRMLPLLKLDL